MHPNLTRNEYLAKPFQQKEPTHPGWAGSLGVLQRWLGAVVQQRRRRKMIATLEAMDDWVLRDIGISRGDISRVVDGFDERELRMVPLAPSGTAANIDDHLFRQAA